MADLLTTPDTSRRDEVELALMQARELIESTVSIHRSRPAQRSLIVMGSDDRSLAEAVQRLVGGARHSVSVALPGGPGQEQDVLRTSLGVLSAAARRGVRVRLLTGPRMLPAAEAFAAENGEPECEVRVVQGELQPTLVVDGRIALVRPAAERARRHTSLVRDPAAVRALDLLFAGAWSSAVRLAEHVRLNESLRGEFVGRILERLCAGRTDETAAREIQVSLRTYRRHVAEIMRALGASSRFQAGVRAVELGLLPAR
ncbi:helix-turn-helix transcriptional regulator [Streptomyces sp. TP-A0874]|uniref:helix-turn-helix transcriptional regulator n=1 Tax=Streptomyces sp. TP-A0874 TaxID=549819 RepID=UPI0008537D38|nr:hypothetical protein [Streptomyces sp. TP-A0874]